MLSLENLYTHPSIAAGYLAFLIILGLALRIIWQRHEWRFFRQPSIVFQMGFAISLAVFLLLLEWGFSLAFATWLNSHELIWPTAGSFKLSLFLIAIIYGPLLGFVSGLVFAIFYLISGHDAIHTVLLIGELLALGVLARGIPLKQQRLAAVIIVAAYALSFFSVGLASFVLMEGKQNASSLWWKAQTGLGGTLLSALIIFYFSPLNLIQLFPFSDHISRRLKHNQAGEKAAS